MTDIFTRLDSELTDKQKNLILQVKLKAQELHDLYYLADEMHCMIAKDREQIEIAVRKLEESVMWAVKSISL